MTASFHKSFHVTGRGHSELQVPPLKLAVFYRHNEDPNYLGNRQRCWKRSTHGSQLEFPQECESDGTAHWPVALNAFRACPLD